MAHVKRTYIQNRLRRQRMILGCKLTDTAKYMDHSNPSRVSQWERGECFPSAENLFKLSILYNKPIDELFADYKEKLKRELIEQGKLPLVNS